MRFVPWLPCFLVAWVTQADLVVQRQDLGQSLQLGQLYDITKDTGMTQFLYLKEEIPKYTATTNVQYTELDFVMSQDMKDKMALLDIDADLQMSLMSGKVEVDGFAKFIKGASSKFQSASASMKLSARLFNKRFDGFFNKSIIPIPASLESGATHVVTGITYGVNCLMTVTKRFSSTDDKMKVEGMLHAVMQLAMLSISAKVEVNLTNYDTFVSSDFEVKTNCDLRMDKFPTTLEGAVKLFQTLPTKIVPANFAACFGPTPPDSCTATSVAKTLQLSPLSVLDPSAVALAHLQDSLDRDALDKTTDVMSSMATELATLDDLFPPSPAPSREPDAPFKAWGDVLQDYRDRLETFQATKTALIGEKLEQLRRGKAHTTDLLDVVSEFYTSEFSPSQFDHNLKMELMKIRGLMSLSHVLPSCVQIASRQDEYLFSRLSSDAGIEKLFVFVLFGFQPTSESARLLLAFANFAQAVCSGNGHPRPQFLFVHKESFGDSVPDIPHIVNDASTLLYEKAVLQSTNVSMPSPASPPTWRLADQHEQGRVDATEQGFKLQWKVPEHAGSSGSRIETIQYYRILGYQWSTHSDGTFALQDVPGDLRTEGPSQLEWATRTAQGFDFQQIQQCTAYQFQVMAVTDLNGTRSTFSQVAYLHMGITVSSSGGAITPGDQIRIKVVNSTQRPLECNLSTAMEWIITVNGKPCNNVQVDFKELEEATCTLPKDLAFGPAEVRVVMLLGASEEAKYTNYPEARSMIYIGPDRPELSFTTIRGTDGKHFLCEQENKLVMVAEEKPGSHWVLMQVGDAYHIFSGTPGQQRYLSRTSNNLGTSMELEDTGRSEWVIERGDDFKAEWYYIKPKDVSKFLGVEEGESKVHLYDKDDGSGRHRWLLPEWSPVGYTCEANVDYAENDLGREVPHQDIFSDQACADKCDLNDKCQGFVTVPSNPHGLTPGCYLKKKMENRREMKGWKSCKPLVSSSSVSDTTLFV